MGINEIGIEDVDKLKSIASRCLIESIDLDEYDRVNLIAHTASNIDQFSVQQERVFLKFARGDDILGYILIKEHWNLSDLFVLPEHQRSGIGRQLLLSAIELAKKRTNRGYIWVNSSLIAENFYRAHGFKNRMNGSKASEYSVPLELLV